jgi:hypothetical protein
LSAAILATALLAAPTLALASATSPGLWITDDGVSPDPGGQRLYKIATDGTRDASVGFPITGAFGISRSDSGIGVDNTNGTLWLAGEKSATFGTPGGVVNWTTSGSALSGISESVYGGQGTEGVDVDLWAHDGTLWVVDDPDPGFQAKVFHVDRSGGVIASYNALQAFTSGPSQQEIAVDPTDGTLWVTDNVANRIFHFARPGPTDAQLAELSRINPVGTGNFGNGTPGVDRLTDALQGVSVDPRDGTLWVTARKTTTFAHGKIYHITRLGVALASFLTINAYGGENPTGAAFACLTCAPHINVSPQAIDFGTVASGSSATAQVTIANSGTDVLRVSSLALSGSADFTLGAAAPATPFEVAVGGSVQVPVVYTPSGQNTDTGNLAIASNDPNQATVTVSLAGREPAPQPTVDLGAARPYTLLGLEGVKLSFSNSKSGVAGDVAMGPGGVQNFADGFITGRFFVDPTANNTKSNNVVIGGGTVITDLSQAVRDARSAASTAAGLPATRTYKEFKNTSTVAADAGRLNVFSVGKVDLKSGDTLTISGTSSTDVVVNVSGDLKLSGGAGIKLAGGLLASHVFVNVLGTGGDVALSGGSNLAGQVLAADRKVAMSGASIVNGKVIAGRDIALTGGSQVKAATP